MMNHNLTRGLLVGVVVAAILIGHGTRALAQVPLTIEELDAAYTSSEDPEMTLYATFLKSGDKPKSILVYLPGWHGNRRYLYRDLRNNEFMLDRFFLVTADMRGRGAKGNKPFGGTPDTGFHGTLPDGPVSGGRPDANGWELNDVVDAAEFAKKRYSTHTLDDPVYTIGHSGGGGNVMGLVGKFPDYFSGAYAGSGMSDYGEWARLTGWRSSIEKWVGAKLAEKPDAFRSRGGLTTSLNRLTPIALSHGDKDTSVPHVLSQMYVDKNRELGKPVPFKLVKGAGHGVWGHYEEIIEFITRHKQPPVLAET
jgi:pimeloyl-ACP methyl ester carboxylesterase